MVKITATHSHNGKLLSNRRNELSNHANIHMNLRFLLKSKRSQSEKALSCMILFSWHSEKAKYRDANWSVVKSLGMGGRVGGDGGWFGDENIPPQIIRH